MERPSLLAYISLFLKVIDATPNEFYELATVAFQIYPADHVKTIQYAMAKILSKRTDRPKMVQRLRDLVPAFDIPDTLEDSTAQGSSTIQFTAKRLLQLKVGDPRWQFIPTVSPDIISETFEVSGTLAMGNLGTLEDVMSTLMSKFALTSATTVARDGTRIRMGYRTPQTKSSPQPGLIIGFVDDWEKKHELTFKLSVKNRMQSVKIKGTIPLATRRAMTVMPDSVKIVPVTVVYPRHHMSGLQMVMLLTSNSVAPYIELHHKKMGTAATVGFLDKNGNALSGVTMEVQYDGGSVYVRGDRSTPAYHAALRFAAYTNGLPRVKVPPSFDILVPVSGHTYGISVEYIRRAQRNFPNHGDVVSFTYNGAWQIEHSYPNRNEHSQVQPAGRSDIEKYGLVPGDPDKLYQTVSARLPNGRRIQYGRPVARVGEVRHLSENYVIGLLGTSDGYIVEIYQVTDAYDLTAEPLLVPEEDQYINIYTSDEQVDEFLEEAGYEFGDVRNLHEKNSDEIQFWHNRASNLEYPANHIYLPLNMQLTTVSRRIPRTGVSGNSSSNVTGSLSSPPFVPPEWHAKSYNHMVTAILWVRMAQRASGVLSLIMASECVYYSRKYQTLVVSLYNIPDHTLLLGPAYADAVHEGLDRTESGDYPMGGSNIVIKQARFLPEEYDDWQYIVDPRITRNTVEYTPSEQVITDGIVEYYVVYYNEPHKPFFLLANVEIEFGARISKAMLYANDRDRKPYTAYPKIKGVTTDFPYEPEEQLATPYNVSTEWKRDYPRPGKPGTYGTIRFANEWKLEVFTPPFRNCQYFALYLLDSTAVQKAWDRAYTKWLITRRGFERNLAKGLKMRKMHSFEWWFEMGYYATGEATPDRIWDDKYGTRNLAIIDALEQRFDQDIYVLLAHKVPNLAVKGPTIAITLMSRPRLWERKYKPESDEKSQRPVFLWSRNPLTHAHPTSDPYYHLARFSEPEQEAEVMALVAALKPRPVIPEGTRFVSFDNDGPAKAFDGEMNLLGTGPFTLRRNATYAHWETIYERTKWDTLHPPRVFGRSEYLKGGSGVFSLPDDSVIYYGYYFDLMSGIDGYYISSTMRAYLMMCANSTMKQVAKSRIQRISKDDLVLCPRAVPGTRGLADNFYRNAEHFRQFYRNSGIKIEADWEAVANESAIGTPSFMAVPFRMEAPKVHKVTYQILNREE